MAGTISDILLAILDAFSILAARRAAITPLLWRCRVIEAAARERHYSQLLF